MLSPIYAHQNDETLLVLFVQNVLDNPYRITTYIALKVEKKCTGIS